MPIWTWAGVISELPEQDRERLGWHRAVASSLADDNAILLGSLVTRPRPRGEGVGGTYSVLTLLRTNRHCITCELALWATGADRRTHVRRRNRGERSSAVLAPTRTRYQVLPDHSTPRAGQYCQQVRGRSSGALDVNKEHESSARVEEDQTTRASGWLAESWGSQIGLFLFRPGTQRQDTSLGLHSLQEGSAKVNVVKKSC